MVEQQYNQNDLSSQNKMPFLKSPRKSTAEALFTNEPRISTITINKKCRFCRGHHWTDECRTYPTIEKRKEVIRGSCYRCLRPGHRSRIVQMTNCASIVGNGMHITVVYALKSSPLTSKNKRGKRNQRKK